MLLVHYKKEQLMRRAAGRLRPTLVVGVGPGPYPLRRGVPTRGPICAPPSRAPAGGVGGHQGSVTEVGVDPRRSSVVPNVLRSDEIRFSAGGARGCATGWGSRRTPSSSAASPGSTTRSANDVVVRAVIALKARAHVLLAGDGETEANCGLRRAARRPRALHPDARTRDPRRALRLRRLGVLPRPTEGAPRAVILGMLASRPCLSTGPEGVSDMIKPEIGEIASPENDVAATTAVLAGYRDDPERVAREGAHGRALAEERYNSARIAARIEALLTRS